MNRRFSSLKRSAVTIAVMGSATLLAMLQAMPAGQAQTGNPQAMQLRANVTRANAKTGVVVAQGDVQISYPARDIRATAAQATYFSKEARIVLSGNVIVLQEGNSLRGEVITYLVNEGRFEAVPQAGQQVEAIYLVPADTSPAPAPVAPAPAPSPTATKQPFPTAPKAP